MLNTNPTSSNIWLDLRSDTVTRPTPAMREAMAEAIVGDDVYEDDPTVRQLEAKTAQLLGKQAGLFMASGTQSNLTAMLSHCGRGEEILTGDQYHVRSYEAGGASVLGGVVLSAISTDERGGLRPEQVRQSISPDDIHKPVSKLLVLENTVSGFVQQPSQHQELIYCAHANGLLTHLDGARLINAAVKLQTEPSSLAAGFDSVSLCLSKGLGAPVGSVLVGSFDFIKKARRIRKMLGGGMRQAGILAAAGLFALEHQTERLAQDHQLAFDLACALAEIPGLEVPLAKVETNMLFIKLPLEHQQRLRDYFRARGVLLGGGKSLMRIVIHHDVFPSAVERFVGLMKEYATKNL